MSTNSISVEKKQTKLRLSVCDVRAKNSKTNTNLLMYHLHVNVRNFRSSLMVCLTLVIIALKRKNHRIA